MISSSSIPPVRCVSASHPPNSPVYISTVSTDHAEIRVRNARKPTVTVKKTCVCSSCSKRAEKNVATCSSGLSCDSSTILIEMKRSFAGMWQCIITGLSAGTTYDVVVSSLENTGENDVSHYSQTDHLSAEMLRIETIDSSGLGSKRLRIGLLADAHVNHHHHYHHHHGGKRLYQHANFLLEKYANKLANAQEHNVDCIVLPGDVCDTGKEKELHTASLILKSLSVPAYPIVGNHECNVRRFTHMLTPEHERGYYGVGFDNVGVHLILLSTDTQQSLSAGTEQFSWLCRYLDKLTADPNIDIVLMFLHYSLVLHPLHNDGRWDDGLQTLHNAPDILKLMHSHCKVRAIICGHKNVPSKFVDTKGVLHTLSPQLIQVPCGYDVFDIYDNGLIRTVYEIEEMEWQHVSIQAAGCVDASNRWGEHEHRSFRHDWT